MKKLLCTLLAILVVLFMAAGGGGTAEGKKEEDEITKKDVALEDLKQGDSVSIIGQKANSTLVNGNTIWVQVQQEDKSFVIYHCQLKDEYIDKAESIQMLTAVKIKGLFLSFMDMEMENTSPLVTLYDCELID